MQNSFEKIKASRIRTFIKGFDFVQFIVMLGLAFGGVLFIYGIGQQIGGHIQNYWKTQLVWFAIGFTSWFFFSFIFDLKRLKIIAPLIYLLSLGFLVFALLQSKEVNLTKRWISLLGFRFQPSELGKTGLIVMMAWLLSLRDFKLNKIQGILSVILISGLPFILICIQPDLGTAMVIIPTVFFMIFVSGLSWKWIIAASVAICIMIPAGYPFLKGYQKERIKVFLDPDRDPKNRGWNSLQAELAVGSGGIHGKGFMQGTQHTLGFLPQTVSNTDFIFSVIGEETGFVGASSLILLYTILCYSLLRTAALSPDPFGRYLATGVAALIFFHSFVNTAMTIRLLPVTGLPLPLISYGGTFTINTMLLLGMANSAYFGRTKNT
jgi:rod shape determining protein RodA